MVIEQNNSQKKVLESGIACPFDECNSSDAFFVWEHSNGKIDGHCFSCGKTTKNPYETLSGTNNQSQKVNSRYANNTAHQEFKAIGVEEGLSHPIRGIPNRNLSYATCEYFGIRVGVSSTDGETPIYYLFPRYREGNHIGYKTKIPGNTPPYLCSGGNDVELFGSHLCKPQGKKLYITEGEFDAASVFQALKENSNIPGYNPSVVSLPSGASSALKSMSISSTLLDGYDEIIIVFDNDSSGIEARNIVCKAFAGKVSYVNIPHPYKDASDMVQAGKSSDLKWLCLTHARKYQPDGILTYNSLKEKFLESPALPTYFPYPEFLPILNEKIYGAFVPSVVTLTSGTGCGKTQFMKEILYHYYLNTNEKIAGMFLEESSEHTIKSLISLDINKKITLPDVEATEEEKNESFERLFGSNRITLYDYFGGMDDSSLLSKLKYFAITGHKFIFLDHLSIVLSEYAAEGGEVARIDSLMTKLAKFAKEFDIILFQIVHLRKGDASSTAFEQGAVPSLDDLRGSGTLKQLSWDVIAFSRNQQHSDNYCANITKVTVLKNRTVGWTGTADHVYYDDKTGRLLSVEPPANYIEPPKRKGIL